MLGYIVIIAIFLIGAKCLESYKIISKNSIIINKHSFSLSMGLADIFKNALANDPNLPPAKNPGLSVNKEPVEVEFLPSNKKVKAYLGQNLGKLYLDRVIYN